MEALICIGAFNNLGAIKSRYMAGLTEIMLRIRSLRTSLRNAQKKGKIYDYASKFDLSKYLPEIKEFPEDVILNLEKRYTGIYMSGHPLLKYLPTIQKISDFNTSLIDYDIDEEGQIIMSSNIRNNTPVRFIAVLNSVEQYVTKARKQLMASIEFEDLEGMCKVMVFPDLYGEVKSSLKENEIYIVDGYVKISSDEAPMVAAKSIKPIAYEAVKRLYFTFNSLEDVQDFKNDIISGRYLKGGSPVYMEFMDLAMILDKKYWLDDKQFEGKENVSIIYS
jgi:DNA polymerase-3 subunit alpha